MEGKVKSIMRWSGSMLLALAIGFLTARFMYLAPGEEMRVVTDACPKEEIRLNLTASEEGFFGKVTPAAILKVGEKIAETDEEGNFEVAGEKSLVAYTENNRIEIETSGLTADGAGETSVCQDETEETVAKEAPKAGTSAPYVASSRGKKYYNNGSSGAKSLSEANKVYFNTKEEAEAAGYEASSSVK